MKRLFASILCIVMLLALLPVSAKADMYEELRQQMKEAFYKDEALDVSQYGMQKEELQTIYDDLYHSGQLPWYAAEDCKFVYAPNQTVGKFRPKVLNPNVYDRETYEIKMAELIRDTCFAGMTDWQIALSVHEYITSHVSYDETYKLNTGYDALVNRTTACYGYAQLFMDVMNRQGIPCKILTCENTGDGYGHAWNAVQLDGQWYHVDATWDDPIPDIYGYSNHLFFLRTDEQFDDPAWFRGFYWEKTEECSGRAYSREMFWENVYHVITFLDKDTVLMRKEDGWDNLIYTRDVNTGKTDVLVRFSRKPVNLGKGSNLYPTAGVCYWNGRIYYNTETRVYSVLPDGTDRREEVSYNARKNKKYIYSCFVTDGVIYLELANHKLDTFTNLQIPIEGYVPHEHTFREEQVAASCAADGWSGKICDCGLQVVTQTIPKTEHRMTSEVTQQATQEQTGTTRHYCQDCGYEELETIPKLPPEETQPTTPAAPEEQPFSIWEFLFGWLW